MRQINPKFEATLRDKLVLGFELLFAIFHAFYIAILVAPFRGRSGASSWSRHIGITAMRRFTRRLSTAQLQYWVNFHEVYENWCRTKKQEVTIDSLDSGLDLFWIGPRDAKNVCLYFHGGGFSIDGDISHLLFWAHMRSLLKDTSQPISFCFVAYGLVPHAVYPTQLTQCVEALSFLLASKSSGGLGRAPGDIVLAGDSAGGTLVHAVLTHLVQPHPSIPPLKLPAKAKFRAVVTIAPGVDFTLTYPSTAKNLKKDIIAPAMVPKLINAYLASSELDVYTALSLGNAKLYAKIGGLVERWLCVAGGEEIMLDGITKCMKRFQEANGGEQGKVTYVIAPGEFHCECVVMAPFGTGYTGSEVAIVSFLKSVLETA